MAPLSFDIFCRVVDNFGDIGVCWRLARQLALRSDTASIRLWVDDLQSFRRIEPRIDPGLPHQSVNQTDIIHWTPDAPLLQPHQVVIEAFACDPPPEFITAMATHRSLWLNLEYLSAESWVESCHGLPSTQADGLKKHFFFPGFTPGTGGLLREDHLLRDRDKWLGQPQLRMELLQSLGLPDYALQALLHGARQVLLFAYGTAPAAGLLNSLQDQPEPTVLLVPQGVCTDLPMPMQNHVQLCRIPFTDQSRFDHLLWSGDLNFVRGEDSLVRALWAGKPMIWQIYPQDDNVHLGKLDAWLDRTGSSTQIGQLMKSWNLEQPDVFSKQLSAALMPENWRQWQTDSQKISNELAGMPDLVSKLISFCAHQRRTG